MQAGAILVLLPPVLATMSLGQLLSLSSSGPGLPLITSDEFLAVDNDLIDVSGHNPLELLFGFGEENTAANHVSTLSQQFSLYFFQFGNWLWLLP